MLDLQRSRGSQELSRFHLRESPLELEELSTGLTDHSCLLVVGDRDFTIRVWLEESLPEWYEAVVRRIAGFLALREDWDSYGGKPTKPTCVATALDLLAALTEPDTPAPQAYPTAGGGVQLDWAVGDLELKIRINSLTDVTALLENSVTGDTQDIQLSTDLGPLRPLLAQLAV